MSTWSLDFSLKRNNGTSCSSDRHFKWEVKLSRSKRKIDGNSLEVLANMEFDNLTGSKPAESDLNKTKSNILSSALKLFNDNGLVNVRLQHIADEAFISIGNMAYHYKNKEQIVIGIHQWLLDEQKMVMAEMNVVPLFEYMGQFLHASFDLQEKYSFFFTDMLEVFRSYPNIADAHTQMISWQKEQYRLALEFNHGRGALVFDEALDIDALIDHMWMCTYMSRSYRLLTKERIDFQSFSDQFWNLLLPIMSEKGRLEFKQFQQLSIM